jgi:hypothetical protein
VAPLTAVIEYTLPVDAEHGVALPVIAPGVAGAELKVIAFVLAADVPHVLVAVTDIFPEVAPIVTVTLVVPCPAVIVAPVGADHV